MTLSRLLSQQQPVPIQMKHLLKCPGATAESKSLACLLLMLKAYLLQSTAAYQISVVHLSVMKHIWI